MYGLVNDFAWITAGLAALTLALGGIGVFVGERRNGWTAIGIATLTLGMVGWSLSEPSVSELRSMTKCEVDALKDTATVRLPSGPVIEHPNAFVNWQVWVVKHGCWISSNGVPGRSEKQ